jgi:UDP-glucose 4-epimerase
MRVLVTGASGALGAALVRRLLEDVAVEHILAVGIPPRSGGGFPGERLQWLAVDLHRSRDLRGLLFGRTRELGVDTVVHMAEHADAHDAGHAVHELNVDRTRELLHLVGRHPTIKKLIHRGHGQIYRIDGHTPTLLDEEQPPDLSPRAPQWVRDRVEADQAVCNQLGVSSTQIVLLRFAEIFAPRAGSQTWDYVQSRVCFRPLGFDPMLHLCSVEDAVEALLLAIHANVRGIFNIPGADMLPISAVIRKTRRRAIPVPAPLLAPLYRWRHRVLGTQFRWDLNDGRYRWNGGLDGTRARDRLGYTPRHPIVW